MNSTLHDYIESFTDEQEFCIETRLLRGTKFHPLFYRGCTFTKRTVPSELLNMQIVEVDDLDDDPTFKFITIEPDERDAVEPAVRNRYVGLHFV